MPVTARGDGVKRLCRSSSDDWSLVAVAAFIALLACGWVAQAQAQSSAGSVTVLEGTASLQRGGNRLDVVVGTVVDIGDTITVESGHLTIVLNDGSVLKAGTSSVLKVDEQLLGPAGAVASTKVSLYAGILRSIVRHTSSGDLPNFKVNTPNAIISVRGTKFDTAYSEGAQRRGFGDCTRFTDIKGYEGRVGARNAALPSSDETAIDGGYETTIACDSPPLQPGPLGMTGIPFGNVDTFVGDVPGAATAPPVGGGGVPALPPVGGKGP